MGAALILVLLAGCAGSGLPMPIPEALRTAPLAGRVLPPMAPEPETLIQARAILAAEAPRLDGLTREGLALLVVEIERETRLPALLLLAVMQQESRFDLRAVGPRGSLGIMQVQPSLGRVMAERLDIPWRGAETLFDPMANVRIGARYLADLVAAFGEHELALAAYNMGPTRLRQRMAEGASGHTRYAAQVIGRYQTLQTRYADAQHGLGG